MPNKELIVLLTNPKIKPSFSEGTVVFLTKNYTESDPFCSEYFKKGVYYTIIECGLSKYPNEIDEQTGYWSTVTNGIEWCTVKILTQEVDPDNEEDFIRAKDLQP